MNAKVKATPRHADSSDPGPWLAQLREEDGGTGNGNGDHAEPAAALPRPYVGLLGGTSAGQEITGGQAVPPEADAHPHQWRRDGTPESSDSGVVAVPAAAPRRAAAPAASRAIIGDELRRPAVWCQMGACVTRYADPHALGEADNRARAERAGWREDAWGRFACPSCLQRSTEFRVRYPVVPWDKERAVAMAILMTVAVRQIRASDPAAETGWLPAIEPGAEPGAGPGTSAGYGPAAG